MKNKYLQKLSIILLSMNLMHATSGDRQITESENSYYTVNVISSLTGETLETLNILKSEYNSLPETLKKRYRKDTNPCDSHFFGQELTEDGKVKIIYHKTARPFRLTNTESVIEMRFMQILDDEVSVKADVTLNTSVPENILSKVCDTLEKASDTYYCDKSDEFYEMFNCSRHEPVLISRPILYVNQVKIFDLQVITSTRHHYIPGQIYQALLYAKKICNEHDRELDDFLITLGKLWHSDCLKLAIHSLIHKYSEHEYSIKYYQRYDGYEYDHNLISDHSDRKRFLFELHFRSADSSWYKPEYEKISYKDRFETKVEPDATLTSIKILHNEFILERSLPFRDTYRSLIDAIDKHLTRTRTRIRGMGLINYYQNIFEGFTFPAEG